MDFQNRRKAVPFHVYECCVHVSNSLFNFFQLMDLVREWKNRCIMCAYEFRVRTFIYSSIYIFAKWYTEVQINVGCCLIKYTFTPGLFRNIDLCKTRLGHHALHMNWQTIWYFLFTSCKFMQILQLRFSKNVWETCEKTIKYRIG